MFGSGSRAPIAITILVKSVQNGHVRIFYRDIGEYLSREEKLAIISRANVFDEDFKEIYPNERCDWINQRGNEFEKFISLHESSNPKYGIWFMTRSNGLKTNRDAWCYNFSRSELETNIQTTIDYYNTHSPTEFDPKKFVWVHDSVQDKNRGIKYEFDAAKIFEAYYRPFCKQYLYFDKDLVQRPGKMDKIFPNGTENLVICVSLADEGKFSPFITNQITDLHFNGDGQCYPLYYYERSGQGGLFGENLERRDGISDYILTEARKRFGDVSKEDIFYYVYHLNYESQPPAQVEIIGGGQRDVASHPVIV